MQNDKVHNLRKQPKMSEKKKMTDEITHKKGTSSVDASKGELICLMEVETNTIVGNMTPETVENIIDTRPTNTNAEEDLKDNHDTDTDTTKLNTGDTDHVTLSIVVGILKEMKQGQQDFKQEMKDFKQEVKQQGLETNANMKQQGLETNANMKQQGLETNANIKQQGLSITKIEEGLDQIRTDVKFELNEVSLKVDALQTRMQEEMEQRFHRLYLQMQHEKEQNEVKLREHYEKLDKLQNEKRDILITNIGTQFKKGQDELGAKLNEQHELILEVEENLTKHTNENAEQTNNLRNQIFKFREDTKGEMVNLEQKITDKLLTREQLHTEKFSQIEQEIRNQSTLGNVNTTQGGQTVYITCGGGDTEYNAPRFNGRKLNPIEYLGTLKRHYTRLVEKRQREGRSNIELTDILDFTLEGAAGRWWQTIREEINTIGEFEERFLERYWSEEIQRGVRHRLDVEKYRSEGPLTRTEYFTERVLTMRNLMPKPSEEEIVKKLCEHFSERVKDARRVQNLKTIREVEIFLNEEDMEERNRQVRDKGPGYMKEFPRTPRTDTRYEPRNYSNRNNNFDDNRPNNRFRQYGGDNYNQRPQYLMRPRIANTGGQRTYYEPRRHYNEGNNYVHFNRNIDGRPKTPYERHDKPQNQTYRSTEQERTINEIRIQKTEEPEPVPGTSHYLN